MLLKPKKVMDIRRSEEIYLSSVGIVNLYEGRVRRIPVRRTGLYVVTGFALLSFFFSPAVMPSLSVKAPTGIFAAQSDAERQQLEAQLEDLQNQINTYETTVTNYRQQGDSLSSEIKILNAKIAKINLQIKAVKLSITQLDDGIEQTGNQIKVTENEIEVHKSAIASLLRSIDEKDSASIVEILLANPRLSDFFGNINDTLSVQSNLRGALQNVITLKLDLIDKQETLTLQKQDAVTLASYQASQKATVDATKQQKNELLEVTKGEESKYQALLTESKKTAAQIRAQIFQLLGGGELTFEKAYEFARQAEAATGVRAAFILAILDRESALGQNVGKCDYRTAMHPTRDIPYFLEILDELKAAGKAPPEPVLVSCANADGAYGGAMGPAQFIPSTWVGYADRVSEITGNNPPSPWSNADAFVAAGLYLRDAGAATDEKKAAARYYCGGRWNRYVCLNVYGAKVVEHAVQFQSDINTLNGSS